MRILLRNNSVTFKQWFFSKPLLIVFLMLFNVVVANATPTKSKGQILVISSYNPDTQRMSGFINDLERGFTKENMDYDIIMEDMGYNGISEVDLWVDRMSKVLNKYRDVKNLKAAVILGQEAYACYLAQEKPLNDVPMFFCYVSKNGIDLRELHSNTDIKNWNPKPINTIERLTHLGHVGGVFNVFDVEKNIKLILSLFPETKNIAFLSDNSYGGISVQSLVKREMPKKFPKLNLILVDGRKCDIDSMHACIHNLPKHSVLLIGSCRIDNRGRYFLQSELSSIQSENPKLPIFSLTGLGINNVVIGGYIPRFADNSSYIVDEIKKHFSGKCGSNQIKMTDNGYTFNRELLKAFDISERSLPAGSVINDNVDKKLEQYRKYVLISAFVAVTLSLLLAISIHFYLRNRRLNRSLKHNELVLIEAKEKAESSERIKSAFIANMSHEIRTPLNAIIGFTDLIMLADSQEERENYRKIVSTNTQLLLKLVNDVLDLSRLEAGYVDLKPELFDVNELINEVSSSFSLRVKPEVKLQTEVEKSSCMVFLDKNRILQVLTNFVGNAAKFTNDGSITIGYNIIPIGIRLYVTDTGKGIDEKEKNKVFERFAKFDSFIQGTGLGLSICKNIIEVMKGEIGVDSKLGEGSTFWCTIPCTPSVENTLEEKTKIVAEDDKESTDETTIILIEPFENVSRKVEEIFKGHALVKTVKTSIEGVELYTLGSCNAIIIDQETEDMSGYDTMMAIREFDTKIPIYIILRENVEKEEEDHFMEKGLCTGLIHRPIKTQVLKDIIASNFK